MTKKLKKCCVLFFLLAISNTTFAQITINNTGYTPAQLVDGILVPSTSGIVISNVNFRGVYNVSSRYQVGYFSTATTTLTQMGFTDGIALTSGNTSDIPISLAINPASAQQMVRNYTSTCSGSVSTTGEIRKGGSCPTIENDLVKLAGASNNYFNVAILEFDFVPLYDNISFRYIFGSEEYNDSSSPPFDINYQCTDYNDKFGFLLSGLGINDPQGFTNNATNLAKLSNGSPVSVNSVNDGIVGGSASPQDASYCSSANPSWIQNTPSSEFLGTIAGTAPNGNTKTLTASQSGLTPGATYHLKLIVMDLRDGNYDSVVYLEAGSFKSICNQDPVVGTVTNPTSVGIGTFETISTGWPGSIPNGILALDSKNKGLVVSRMTTGERDLLTSVEGMLIYNTTLNCFQLYNGTTWNCITPGCVE